MTAHTWPGGVNPATCTDREWFDVTEGALCGGCGNDADDCHPGVPCGDTPPPSHGPGGLSDPFYAIAGLCHYCQHRVDTGQVPEVVRWAARAAAGLDTEAGA